MSLATSSSPSSIAPHGQNAREFATLVGIGVSALDAIRAATVNAATAFGIIDSVGPIAPGKIADLIAVERDPLTDRLALQRVRFVMTGGRVEVVSDTKKR